MYVEDYSGILAPNLAVMVGAHPSGSVGSWVMGNAQTDVNGSNIQRGVLHSFVKGVGVYRCPGDNTPTAVGGPRTRSYSMNIWLNGARTPDDWKYPPDWAGANDGLNLVKSKLSELVEPPPSSVFVFMEEHEQSIEDGYMRVENPMYPSGYRWWAMPSGRHNQVGNVSLADYHVEPVKWKYPKIFLGHGQSVVSPSDPSSLDWQDFRRAQSWVPHKGSP
jgi:hypothetical protein